MTNLSQLTRFGLFDARVPRYTSYPTSPQFSDAVQSLEFKKWVRAIPERKQVSLYVHIPFCRRLCWFCACRTQGTQSDKPVRAYLDVLKSELKHLKTILPKGLTLSRLHWGGGTPTLLSPDMMEELAGAIFDVAPLGKHAEFSVEIDPNEIDAPRLAVLARAGMNRASVGVQDFDPKIQETIGRIQSYEITRDAIHAIRAHNIKSLNADILYGLPYQNTVRITQSVEKLLSLKPDRVALYGYAHVPWMAKRQKLIPADALPTAEQRLGLFDTARTLFQKAGYLDIGIDHYALKTDGLAIAQKSGQLRRNFQGYTDDPADVLIGIGASSISRFPQGFTQNAPATPKYMAAIRDGYFSVAKGFVFNGDDLLRSRLIEALMCDFRIDRADIHRRFHISSSDLNALFQGAVDAFPNMVVCDKYGIKINKSARPLTRIIAQHFDAYSAGTARYSSAV